MLTTSQVKKHDLGESKIIFFIHLRKSGRMEVYYIHYYVQAIVTFSQVQFSSYHNLAHLFSLAWLALKFDILIVLLLDDTCSCSLCAPYMMQILLSKV